VNSEKTLVVCFRVRKLQRRLRYYHTHNMLDTSKLTGTEDCMNFSSFKLRHFRCSHDFLSIFKADVPYCIANGRCWPFSAVPKLANERRKRLRIPSRHLAGVSRSPVPCYFNHASLHCSLQAAAPHHLDFV